MTQEKLVTSQIEAARLDILASVAALRGRVDAVAATSKDAKSLADENNRAIQNLAIQLASFNQSKKVVDGITMLVMAAAASAAMRLVIG